MDDVRPVPIVVGDDDLSCAYLLGGHLVRPDTSAGQQLLAEAYVGGNRPQCPCSSVGVPMYIARAGNRLIVKRMPGTGAHHSPDCGSYAPEDLSGLGCLLGDAVRVDPDTGLTVLRLGFRLSVGERAAVDTNSSPTALDSVTTTGRSLTLRALLDYLWEESDLVAWAPGMMGRRHWGLIAWLLRRAAAAARTKSGPLAERVYIPEPFRLEHKAELAAKRLNQWQKASARPGHRQQLMVLIAEIKAIDAARYGHKMVLKHLPDAPLFLDDRLHRRLKRAFAAELDLWAADETSHLVVIATFTVGRGGAAMAEEVALMPTTAQWLPYQDPYAKVLLDRLVDTQRRFRTTPRFSLPPTVDLPIAVLTDTREPTPCILGTPKGTPRWTHPTPPAGRGDGTSRRPSRRCRRRTDDHAPHGHGPQPATARTHYPQRRGEGSATSVPSVRLDRNEQATVRLDPQGGPHDRPHPQARLRQSRGPHPRRRRRRHRPLPRGRSGRRRDHRRHCYRTGQRRRAVS